MLIRILINNSLSASHPKIARKRFIRCQQRLLKVIVFRLERQFIRSLSIHHFQPRLKPPIFAVSIQVLSTLLRCLVFRQEHNHFRFDISVQSAKRGFMKGHALIATVSQNKASFRVKEQPKWKYHASTFKIPNSNLQSSSSPIPSPHHIVQTISLHQQSKYLLSPSSVMHTNITPIGSTSSQQRFQGQSFFRLPGSTRTRS